MVNLLYDSKKESTNGRKFIWKIAASMVVEKPLLGYGYGFFEKEYNIFQSKYIDDGKANSQELRNASHVFTAYNEFLQNAVEGGIIGLGLLILFMYSLLYNLKLHNKTNAINVINSKYLQKTKTAPFTNTFKNQQIVYPAYLGIVAFILMSFFNFTMQSIPCMTMMSIYTALIVSKEKSINFSRFKKIRSNVLNIYTSISLSVLAVFLLCFLIIITICDRVNKKALIKAEQGDFKKSMELIIQTEPVLKPYSNYWESRGLILFKMKQYLEAINCFNNAKKTSSAINLYLMSGLCYEKLKQYSNSISEYNQAVLFTPSKFRYRYLLMRAYLKNKDTLNAQKTAQGIIDLKPKVASKKIANYKKIAKKIKTL